MKKGKRNITHHHIVRRVVHSMVWVYLVYYLLPKELFGYSRRVLLLGIILFILCFEGVRIYKGWKVFGMRHYEKKSIAAYAWATMAAGIALLLFPFHLVVICMVGMGIVDPVAGELREFASKFYPAVPLVLWTMISLLGYITLTSYSYGFVIFLSIAGAFSAVGAEAPKLIIDDDFLMVVVPLIILRGLEFLFI